MASYLAERPHPHEHLQPRPTAAVARRRDLAERDGLAEAADGAAVLEVVTVCNTTRSVSRRSPASQPGRSDNKRLLFTAAVLGDLGVGEVLGGGGGGAALLSARSLLPLFGRMHPRCQQ